MNELKNFPINLEMTLLGGQAFSWDKIDNYYYGVVGSQVIKVKQDGDTLFWQTFPQKDNYALFAKYFRINEKYEEILKLINKDKYVAQAIGENHGLRLLSADPSQTIISYIISANKNIPGIRSSTRKLSEMYGEKIIVDDNVLYTFPLLQDLAEASIEDLLKSKVGFRAKYIKSASQALAGGVFDEILNSKDENEVRKNLVSLYGVGDKIADCVMSYSLGFNNVTAMDVWGKRFAKEYYGVESNKYDDLRSFFANYFDGYAAWGGQFLFEYIRKNWKGSK